MCVLNQSHFYYLLNLKTRFWLKINWKSYLTDGGWETNEPVTVSVGNSVSPVTRMLAVTGKLWCGCQNSVKIVDVVSLEVEVWYIFQEWIMIIVIGIIVIIFSIIFSTLLLWAQTIIALSIAWQLLVLVCGFQYRTVPLFACTMRRPLRHFWTWMWHQLYRRC